MKTVAVSIFGNVLDMRGGRKASRWDVWRPNVGLVQQDDLRIDELHLVCAPMHGRLVEQLKADIGQVSPGTTVAIDFIDLKAPWDFEEVYGKFYDYAQGKCFHEEQTQYYVHITTGSHVEQICLFLLAESRHLPGKLLQTSPGRGRAQGDPRGTVGVIDLDLSRYDKLAERFEVRRRGDLSFLKCGIETRNAAFNKLIETIERVATRSSAPILLTGETGVGKSMLARQIYLLKKQTGKVKGKFVAVNCATLDGDTAKSALFGHARGAFTGAAAAHDGFLKEADGGILFLDEVGELPTEAQAMLLKAIEEKMFRPLGAAGDEHSDFQLICGTNRDLGLEVERGRFRADLLARIDLWSFRLPGLAERREDIEPNLDYELAGFAQRTGRFVSFNKEAREKFLGFALAPETRWPGNFRDLDAMVMRMATLADGGRITPDLVGEEIVRGTRRCAASRQAAYRKGVDLADLLGADCGSRYDSFELAQLSHAVAVCRESGSAASAAKKLYAVSRLGKKSSNDSDRLLKYLARFGLKFGDVAAK